MEVLASLGAALKVASSLSRNADAAPSVPATATAPASDPEIRDRHRGWHDWCAGGSGIVGGGAVRDSDDGGDGAVRSAMAGEREKAEAGVEGANPSSISRY